MRLFELENPQTKTGKTVEFRIEKDSDIAVKPAWRVDKITALVEGEEAGYIKLSWIPEEKFRKQYPSIFNWLSEERGIHFLKEGENWQDASPERKVDILNSILNRLRLKISNRSKVGQEINDLREKYNKGWYTDLPKDIPEETSARLLKALERATLKDKRWGPEFQKFKDFFIDKPIVDYIRVYDQKDPKGPGRDYRRMGIGRLLYRRAGEYLKDMGLKLHASGLQSDEAKAAWADLERRGLVEPGDRKTLRVEGKG